MNSFAHKKLRKVKSFCLMLLVMATWSCHKEDPYLNLPIYGPTQFFYALSNQNTLFIYNAKDVRNSPFNTTITGLAASESILAIDFRPATGELYGISTLSKLYLIDGSTGAAKAVSANPFSPIINGTAISIDFNPVDDRLRVITNTGQNFRLNPETGTVEGSDTNLSTTAISGIAYNNNYTGATASVLYDIDATAGKLYKQEPQNAGTLVSVGNLGLAVGNNACFDISPGNINALAVGTLEDGTKLFTIDLSTGKATLAGKFAQNVNIRGIAIPTSPVVYTIDDANNLVIFNPTVSKPTLYNKPITGLQTGETIYGIDMRPLNGQLYALGSSNRLYTINIGTGAVTVVGTLATALSGTSFGVDFNPSTDVIRVVSNTGQNLRVNPVTAAVTVDPSITPATAKPSAAAFTNNFRAASSTVLYVIDDVTNKLYKQDPNTGVLTAPVDLNIDITEANGFDMLYNSGDIALGIFTVGTKTNLYSLNLATGEAKPTLEFSKPVRGFTTGLKFN